MANGVTLRTHRPGDIGWVTWRHGVLYAAEHGLDERFEVHVADVCARFVRDFDPACERLWIAEHDGEPVGSVMVVRKDDTTAQLRMLLVEAGARGLGVGTRLVDEVIAFARAAGYREVVLWTLGILHDARRLYERAGFALVAEEPHRSFGHDLVAQTWSLAL